MKRKIIIISSVAIALCLTVAAVVYLGKIKTDKFVTGQAVFEYSEINISENLSEKDLAEMK